MRKHSIDHHRLTQRVNGQPWTPWEAGRMPIGAPIARVPRHEAYSRPGEVVVYGVSMKDRPFG